MKNTLEECDHMVADDDNNNVDDDDVDRGN